MGSTSRSRSMGVVGPCFVAQRRIRERAEWLARWSRSIRSEWVNRRTGAVSHSFHWESIRVRCLRISSTPRNHTPPVTYQSKHTHPLIFQIRQKYWVYICIIVCLYWITSILHTPPVVTYQSKHGLPLVFQIRQKYWQLMSVPKCAFTESAAWMNPKPNQGHYHSI